MKSKLRRAWHYGSWAATLVLLVGWTLFLRPQSLGGDATYVVVRGDSMLPAYRTGDLVIVRAANTYNVGDAIAYRVPAGEEASGTIVIHRITGGDATNGFIIQGDNNSGQDPWNPRLGDMVGKAALHLPMVGRVTVLLHDPVMLGGLAAGLTVMWIVARPPSKKKDLGAEGATSESGASRSDRPSRLRFPPFPSLPQIVRREAAHVQSNPRDINDLAEMRSSGTNSPRISLL